MNNLGHLRIGPVTLEPGQEWEPSPKAWHFLHIQSGAAYWLSGARPRSLSEREMLLIAPGVAGVVRASQIGPVTLQSFHFAPDRLYGFFTLPDRHLIESLARRFRDVHVLPSTHPVTQRFVSILASGSRPEGLAQRAAALGLAAVFFEEQIARDHPAAARGASAQHRFEMLVAEMPDTELMHHSPEQLACLCGCSRRHFHRLFRRSFGVSLRGRQTELRLLKARQMLFETDQKILQVARESGYRNLSLFNSLFKKRFGATPSEYRRGAARERAGTDLQFSATDPGAVTQI